MYQSETAVNRDLTSFQLKNLFLPSLLTSNTNKVTEMSIWLEQQLDQMAAGIAEGKTRRRKTGSFARLGVKESEMKRAVLARGWRVAQIGEDYIFAPHGYTIRPIA